MNVEVIVRIDGREVTTLSHDISGDPIDIEQQFGKPITIVDAACELGLEDVNRLKYANLRRMGLGVFEQEGGVIQRTFWAPAVTPETGSSGGYKRSTTSIFDNVVNRMDLGTSL
ncbi:MAG: hypothetical protein RIK87_09745 [Fuerstiella sp.]